MAEKEFFSCNGDECEDCPNFEECINAVNELHDDYEDEYEEEEALDRILEQQEMEDFAQDGDFDNMPPGGYYDDGEW